jgi:hypothetical protein
MSRVELSRVKSGRTAFGDALGQFPKKGELSVKCRRRVCTAGQRGESEEEWKGMRREDERREELRRSCVEAKKKEELEQTEEKEVEGSSFLSLQRGPPAPAATAGKKLVAKDQCCCTCGPSGTRCQAARYRRTTNEC